MGFWSQIRSWHLAWCKGMHKPPEGGAAVGVGAGHKLSKLRRLFRSNCPRSENSSEENKWCTKTIPIQSHNSQVETSFKVLSPSSIPSSSI